MCCRVNSGQSCVVLCDVAQFHRVYISELSDAVNQAPGVLLSRFARLLLVILLVGGCCVLTEQLP